MKKLKDQFGERMKGYEKRETSHAFLPYIPVYARVDGRSFSKFTKNAIKPFDHSIYEAMYATAAELVRATNAKCAYLQSDEISLVWETTEMGEEILFNGKAQKLCSVLSGIATAAFIKTLAGDVSWNERNPDWLDQMPHFDARVLQLPNRVEAANMFLWREGDARKNAISQVAQSLFSHKRLQGVNGRDMIKMMADEKNIDFENDYPVHNRRGTFIHRQVCEMEFGESAFFRTVIGPIPMPPFNTVTNRVEVIFDGAVPDVG